MVYFATVTKLLFISTSLSSCFHCNENSREDFRTFSPNFFFSSLFFWNVLCCAYFPGWRRRVLSTRCCETLRPSSDVSPSTSTSGSLRQQRWWNEQDGGGGACVIGLIDRDMWLSAAALRHSLVPPSRKARVDDDRIAAIIVFIQPLLPLLEHFRGDTRHRAQSSSFIYMMNIIASNKSRIKTFLNSPCLSFFSFLCVCSV